MQDHMVASGQKSAEWSFGSFGGYPDSDVDEGSKCQDGIAGTSNQVNRSLSSHNEPDHLNSNTETLFGGPVSRPILDDNPSNPSDDLGSQIAKRFSDDDDDVVEGDCDRSFRANSKSKATTRDKRSPRHSADNEEASEDSIKSKPMSGGKKSPRRSDEDGDDEASEGNRRAKKPRRLLFASPSDDDTKDYDTPPQTADSVRNRMSNLNLTQNNLESMEVDYSMSSDLRVGNGAPSEFCVSQRGSPAPSDASNGFLKTSSFPAKDLGWNYDLRENIDRQIQSTWLDHDNTGNYDPQAESREKAIELNKAKARKKKGKQQTTPKQVVKKFIMAGRLV